MDVMWVLLPLLQLLPMVFSCSCVYQHPQIHYCKADFVIKARVQDEKYISSGLHLEENDLSLPQIKYKLEIIKVFKYTQAFNKSSAYVYTATSDTLCGLTDLEPGIKYLMTGHIFNDKLHITLCDFVQPFDKLTKWQTKGISSRFSANCDCEIHLCYHDHCNIKNEVENQGHRCILELHKDRNFCYLQHSYCRRPEPGGDCTWATNKFWRQCRKGKHHPALVSP